MVKLSKIFENVDHTKSYEKQKREYFAKKIFESFLISEGKSSKGFGIDEVTNKIFLEAIKYGNEKKAIRFVKDIENEFMMNEGFMDTIKGAVKGAANWVKDKVSKVIGKIKDWFAGPIQKAFTAFNAKVKPATEKLMKEGKKTLVNDTTKTAELAAPETPKLLTQSLTITVPQDYSYLMEGLNLDMSGDAAKGPIDHAVVGAEGDADDGAEADAGVQAMADNLFGGKKIESGKKTGSTQARVKFYAITKSGNNSTLWVGPDPTVNTMKALGAYMASSGKIFLNLADDIIGSQLEMDLIANLFLAIKNNPKLNPKGEYGAVSNAGKKIIVDHIGKKMQIIPGKLVIAGVGGKAGLPMKLKGASTQEKFMGVLGIKKQEEETGTDTEVVANNTAKEDGKPKQEDFVDGFGKPDVAAFEAAMKEWADKEDDKDFGTDHNGEEVDYLIDLEAKINQFFGMNHEDLINNKLDDVVDTVFEKTPVVVEDLNGYNDNIGTVLEYYQGTDKKLTPEQATAIAGDLNAIVEVSYPKVIARSLEKVETPEEKQAIVDRGINLANELVKIAASHGVTFTFDKTKWAEKTGGLELKDWTDGTNYGDLTGDALEASKSAYGKVLSDPTFKDSLKSVAGESMNDQQALLDALIKNGIKPENAGKLLATMNHDEYVKLVAGGSIDRVIGFAKQIGFDEKTMTNIAKYAGEGRMGQFLDAAYTNGLGPDKIKGIINTAGGTQFIDGLINKSGLEGFMQVAKDAPDAVVSKMIGIAGKAPGTMETLIGKGLNPAAITKVLSNDYITPENVGELVKNNVLKNMTTLTSTYNFDSAMIGEVAKVKKEIMDDIIKQAMEQKASPAVMKKVFSFGVEEINKGTLSASQLIDAAKETVANAGQATEIMAHMGSDGQNAIALAVDAADVATASKIAENTLAEMGAHFGSEGLAKIDPNKFAQMIVKNMENPKWYDALGMGKSKLDYFKAAAEEVARQLGNNAEYVDGVAQVPAAILKAA